MKAKRLKMLPRKQLEKIFQYKNGALYWRDHKMARGRSGRAARTNIKGGHKVVSLGGIRYTESRIIYFMENGVSPEMVHHADHFHRNNKAENLQGLTATQHRQTHAREVLAGKTTEEGYPRIIGVHYNKSRRKWIPTMDHKYLGQFDDYISAVEIRLAAEQQKFKKMLGLGTILSALKALPAAVKVIKPAVKAKTRRRVRN